MKQKIRRHASAFTRFELVVVIVIIGALVATILPSIRPARQRSGPSCMNRLQNIGRAYRLWADDHGGHFPASESVTNRGWKELLSSPDQGAKCWVNYAIMADVLGQSPKLLVCPADERTPAARFNSKGMDVEPVWTNFMTDNTVSYFVGVSADESDPRSILGGDRNLGPGTVPAADYGYSPANARGNDVAIPIAGQVSWSLKMHSAGNTAGVGNILLGDGSVQFVSSADFRTNWLSRAAPTTNWPPGHIPSSPSIRLIFP
jgi:hypothetical protein